jgi:hypothetical protein
MLPPAAARPVRLTEVDVKSLSASSVSFFSSCRSSPRLRSYLLQRGRIAVMLCALLRSLMYIYCFDVNCKYTYYFT